MKLSFLLLITAIMQVSASSYAQKITMTERNAQLVDVFNRISEQTGYDFLFTASTLKGAKPVNIEVKNMELNVVLKKIFEEQPLEFTFENRSIVIRQKINESLTHPAKAQDSLTRISGKVLNEKGEGMAGASVKVKGTPYATVVGGGGDFTTQVKGDDAVLVITYLGYKTKEVTVSGADVTLVIRMEPDVAKLSDVTIVSTGYQALPKERATGSFEKIDNKLFNRTSGPTVIARLEGTTASLLFDKRESQGSPSLNQLSIRGISTLDANRAPLVVLDNFPYEGDVNNINPNDVESITILKDAAAASIWGVRAGNGVIVITTKKGAYDKPMQASFNTNVSVIDKPDLFYLPQMKTSDYIDVEKMLFNQGAYDSQLSDTYTYPLVSPVVDILNQERSGLLSASTANTKIDALRQLDVRNDYLKYVYRKSVDQQYALNLNGGSKTLNYIVSAGYDNDLNNTVRNWNDRLTLRSDLFFKPTKNLEFNFGSIFTQAQTHAVGLGTPITYKLNDPTIPPYTRLADDLGNPLVVGKDYNVDFVKTAVEQDPRLLNWQYKPLGELDASSNIAKVYDYLLNLGGTYTFSKVFSFDVKYQYQRTIGNTQDLESQDSYYTRNLINLYTQPVGSPVERPIPLGGILTTENDNASSYKLRGQFNVNKSWGDKGQLTAIAGAESSQTHSLSNEFTTYGYDPNLLTYQNVDFSTQYNLSLPLLGGTIPYVLSFDDIIYRFTSLFANAAYTYNSRYTLSASVRKDASNLFGVKANQRGVPLWSVGGAWNIANEPFYHVDLLPVLKLRATYGYNGNTINDVSAYSIIEYRNAAPYTGLPEATIQNPANGSLQWEKTGIFNLGLDFGFKNNRLSGSLEYYTKDGKDILYPAPVGLSTGFTSATTNSVDMKGKGADITFHSINIVNRLFKWNSDFIFSYNQSKVTKYTPLSPPTASQYVSAQGSIAPILGKPLYAVYSYKWAGLDPQTGDPQGYDSQGKISKDYPTLLNAPVSDLQYSGSEIPVIFGNFRNTFTWKNISISANIMYKLDYYFKRSSIDYSALFSNGRGNADFANRWQKPGDEKTTNVPSMIYPADNNRDMFYQNSAALVDKGDHVRLQDITASYSIDKPVWYFKNIRLYGSISNLGIIWRANKDGIDPDYGSAVPAPKIISLGLNANF